VKEAMHRYAVATADGTEEEQLRALSALLHSIRTQLKMDVVFVSEFTGGRRVFRHVDAAAGPGCCVQVGGSDPLEDSYCQRVVDGRLPQVMRDARQVPAAAELPATEAVGVGGHLSVPIVLKDGRVFGTVCCFSHQAQLWLSDKDAVTLRSIARLIAANIDRQSAAPAG
jgi:GAF domain-containing protein